MAFRTILLLLLFFGGKGPDPKTPNDSAFNGSGANLVPVKETDIDLRREVLNMQLQDGEMHVDVHFEFYNPGDSKTLTVGFVTPPRSEGGEASEGSPIEAFRVIANGKEKQAQVQKLGESKFDSGLGKEWTDFDYVHHFEVTFEPGLNVIEHSYSYGGTFSVNGEHSYPYRLTTGKNWANGTIEDFTLNLDMGEGIFKVTPFFEEGALASEWEPVGRGNTVSSTDRSGKNPMLKCYTDRGSYFTFQKKDFSPDQDLYIKQRSFYPNMKSLGPVLIQDQRVDDEEEDLFREMWTVIARRDLSRDEKLNKLREYQASELRVLRNAFFAMRGYDFNDEQLQKRYEQYVWYIPDPEVEPTPSILSKEERKWVKRIQKLEEAKKE